jgi:hypothetical protein
MALNASVVVAARGIPVPDYIPISEYSKRGIRVAQNFSAPAYHPWMSDPAPSVVTVVESDLVSPSVRQVLQAGAYDALVPARATGSPAGKQLLSKLDTDGVLRDGLAIRSRDDAEAMLAGLWMWVDELDRSHTISQSLHSPTGSFWHAIMHRREGDFSNAKYWYARCRNHPAVAEVSRRAGKPWEPNAFVDAVERLHARGENDPGYADAVRLQRIEWAALFDHCARAAAGRD